LLKFFLFFLFSTAFAEDLVIKLETAQTARFVYLSNILIESDKISEDYAKTLHKTLLFDLRCGGFAHVLSQKEESEKRVLDETFNIGYWSNLGTHYVIVPEIRQNKITIKIFDVKHACIRELLPLELSSSIREDRLLIHKISDLIHKSLFGVEGIAQKRILFAMQPEEGSDWISEIWECGIDGNDLKQISFENSYSICPLFIPEKPNNKNRSDYSFMYVCYKHGAPKIYMNTSLDRQGFACIPLRGNQLLPAISRKFDKIAFICDASGRADLFLQLFDKERGVLHKPVQIFSHPNSVQASPTFSPDGSKLAFVSDKEGTPKIFIVDLLSVLRDRKAPELHCITHINKENTSPSWSSDGKKIVYSAKTNGVRQIWLYDVEKQEEMQLTTGQGDKENPSFAHDSLHIVFNTTSPTFDIFLLDLNQQEPVQITRGPGKKHYPAWEP